MPASVFCDESCHLENDGMSSMSLGSVWCMENQSRSLNEKIRDLKVKHGLPRNHEFKWQKISGSKLEFYKDVITFFFQSPELHARTILIKDKDKLKHEDFEQTHDEWYYKMYFQMLSNVVQNQQPLNIYVDPKDTRHRLKIRKLRQVLSVKFGESCISKIQVVRSHESELMQIADLFAGATCANERKETTSDSKLEIISLIKKLSYSDLNSNSNFNNTKFNFFVWNPRQ
ncbi:MAG: DUF3800 domain-containing protein [Pseudobdellovibrio sp.]